MTVRVLQSFGRPTDEDNPFLALTLDSLPDDIEVSYFTWPKAIFGRYEVFHVHWIESLISGRDRPATAAHWVMLATLLVRLRVTHTRVVRTVHNAKPHGKHEHPVATFLQRKLHSATDTSIVLHAASEPVPGSEKVVIPHGHYIDWFSRYPTFAAEHGRVLFFGLIRPYKGVETLADAFVQTDSSTLRLHIAGLATDKSLAEKLESTAAADARIELQFGHLSDADLAEAVTRAELVVLPYREMHNSGSLLLALSLQRPVLVPDNPMTRELTDEIGDQWIHRYRGELDAAKLTSALDAVHASERAQLLLSERNWSDIGRRTAEIYRTRPSS